MPATSATGRSWPAGASARSSAARCSAGTGTARCARWRAGARWRWGSPTSSPEPRPRSRSPLRGTRSWGHSGTASSSSPCSLRYRRWPPPSTRRGSSRSTTSCGGSCPASATRLAAAIAAITSPRVTYFVAGLGGILVLAIAGPRLLRLSWEPAAGEDELADGGSRPDTRTAAPYGAGHAAASLARALSSGEGRGRQPAHTHAPGPESAQISAAIRLCSAGEASCGRPSPP